jgi:hypothetical protein
MPDDPAAFIQAWTTNENALKGALLDCHNAQQSIDDHVSDLYGIPQNLRGALRDGPPWLAGRGAAVEDAEENAE